MGPGTVSVFLDDPGVVHFYSYATGVSLELPLGFRSDEEDASSATYTDRDGTARVQIRIVARYDSGDQSGPVGELADAFATQGTLVNRRQRTVDDVPARTVLIRRDDGALAHQTVLAADGRLLTVIGLTTAERAEELTPEFDSAVDSIRLITL